MLATHTIDPEDLFTISAGGFNATADAFARDDRTDGLWFVSMVGSQTALKAIWASLLKQPPDVAHIIRGADGMALHGGYERCIIPYETIGTWTTKIARLPVTGGWHALVYTKTAEYGYEKDSFLLLAQSREEAPALHHRFLDKRSPLPLHGSWAGWLWERGIEEEEIVPLQSVGVSAYRCSPKPKKLRDDLSDAVASGRLTLPREDLDGGGKARRHDRRGRRYGDGGREAAGYRGRTGDCVVRAIAICMSEDYRGPSTSGDGRAHEAQRLRRQRQRLPPHGSATAKRPAARARSPPGARPGPRSRGLSASGRSRLPAGAAPETESTAMPTEQTAVRRLPRIARSGSRRSRSRTRTSTPGRSTTAQTAASRSSSRR